MRIAPPQSGQRQQEQGCLAVAGGAADAFSVERRSRPKQRGSRLARRRLARKPKLRIRTKPRGSKCSRKAAQELVHRQRHQPLLVAVCGVAPTEGDVAIMESETPMVGNGYAVGVGAEIAQRVFWSTEGALGVDVFAYMACDGRCDTMRIRMAKPYIARAFTKCGRHKRCSSLCASSTAIRTERKPYGVSKIYRSPPIHRYFILLIRIIRLMATGRITTERTNCARGISKI